MNIVHKFLSKINVFVATRLFQELSKEDVGLLWSFAHEREKMDKHEKFKSQGLLASIHRKITEDFSREMDEADVERVVLKGIADTECHANDCFFEWATLKDDRLSGSDKLVDIFNDERFNLKKVKITIELIK